MSKEVLQRYIQNRLKYGDEFSDIKQDLLTRGYSEQEIDEAYSLNEQNQKPTVLKVNEKIIEKKRIKFDWFNKIKSYKRFLVPAIAGILALLVFEYFKKMPLETVTKTIIVGSVYFLMLLVVLIVKGVIIYNSVLASRRTEMPGMLKRIINLLIVADIAMLFVIPFTISITVWVPVIVGTIIFLLLCMGFLDFNIHETIVSIITYALLNFLILFLITKTTTPEFILKIFV